MAFWATIAFLVPVPPAPFITQKAVVDTEDGHVSFSFHHVLFVLWDVTFLPRSSIFLSFISSTFLTSTLQLDLLFQIHSGNLCFSSRMSISVIDKVGFRSSVLIHPAGLEKGLFPPIPTLLQVEEC